MSINKVSLHRETIALDAGLGAGWRIVTATLTLVMGAGSVQAQNAIEEVLVTAQKREQNVQDIGVSVSAFSDERIRQFGFDTSTKISAQTPGLSIGTPVGEGNNPSIVLRGVGLNDFNDNNEGPVALYRDEVYMGAIAGQTFQLFDMERIEVLRGPQGTLYGRNATGGLVHYIAKRPTDELELSGDFGYGSYDQLRFEGAISGPLNEFAQVRVALAGSRHDGYVENRIGPDGNEGENGAARVLVNFDLNDTSSLLLNLHYGSSDTNAPKYEHQVTDSSLDPNDMGGDFWGYQDNDGNPYEGDYNRDGVLDIENAGVSAIYKTILGSGIALTSVSAYETLDKRHEEDTDVGPLPGIEPIFASDYDQFSQEFRISGEYERGNWVAGVYYFQSNVEGDYELEIQYFPTTLNALNSVPAAEGGFEGGLGLVGAPFTGTDLIQFLHYDVDFDQDTDSYAVFGQTEFEWHPQFNLTLGLRYTREERDYEYTNRVGADEGVLLDFLTEVGVIGANGLIFDYRNGGADVIAGNVNEIDNDNLSGKIGLGWDVSEDVLLFASFSRGFKSGGFNAGFMDTDMQAARDGEFNVNVQYDEEILNSYEVGIKADLLEGRARVNATAFYYDYDDFQALSFFGVSQFIVNSDASVLGGEVEFFARPTESLDLQFGASFLDTEVDQVLDLNTNTTLTDREMVLAPEFSFNGLGRYTWAGVAGGSLTAQVDFNYQGEHFFDITNTSISRENGYFLLNTRLAYVPDNEDWEVALSVENLGDVEYHVYTFNFTGPGGFNQIFQGRPLWVNLDFLVRF